MQIDLKAFKSLNQEMKIRVLKRSIQNFTNAYYSPRSKKIINLIDQFQFNKKTKLTLGGCIIFKEKKHIILKKEIKN